MKTIYTGQEDGGAEYVKAIHEVAAETGAGAWFLR
jgi:hypothetical protein